MIITRAVNARARAKLVVNRRIELDPLSVDFLLDIEFEFYLEDAFLVHELGRFQEGSIEFHRLPLRDREESAGSEEEFRLIRSAAGLPSESRWTSPTRD